VCACGLALTAGCSDQQTPTPANFATAAPTDGSTCGVSALKANPDKYLGDVTITGRAAKVYPADSVVEIADEKACCAVYLFVPFTEAQRAKLGAEDLYQGTLPAVGAQITADAKLKKVEKGYMLKVKEIRAGETVLVAMK
jgi:hypothetical protein